MLNLWIMKHISKMSRNVSINLYLRPCSIAIYGKFYLYCLHYLRLFWSVNCETLSVYYVLHFGSVKIHKHCLYWNVFSTDIIGKIILNCLLLFKPFLLVNYVSWVSKFHNFFSDMLRNWGKVYIWGILLLSFMESSIPTFQYFF